MQRIPWYFPIAYGLIVSAPMAILARKKEDHGKVAAKSPHRVSQSAKRGRRTKQHKSLASRPKTSTNHFTHILSGGTGFLLAYLTVHTSAQAPAFDSKDTLTPVNPVPPSWDTKVAKMSTSTLSAQHRETTLRQYAPFPWVQTSEVTSPKVIVARGGRYCMFEP